ncbi:hypothetical protein D3C80_1975840 [compost metagenome]
MLHMNPYLMCPARLQLQTNSGSGWTSCLSAAEALQRFVVGNRRVAVRLHDPYMRLIGIPVYRLIYRTRCGCWAVVHISPIQLQKSVCLHLLGQLLMNI